MLLSKISKNFKSVQLTNLKSRQNLFVTFEFVRTLAEKQSFEIYVYVKADRGNKIGSQR